jgi:4-amino-4-deoxy-L-arabinose transferase-like glycosyltransferase
LSQALRRPWLWIWGAIGVFVLVLHGVALGSDPPGLYNDEASIGYNAWAIAHGGHDEHGATMPLFFQAFGEYKSPVYIYALAPLTWLHALTPGLIRVPSALSGIAICAVVALLILRLTGSQPAAALAAVTAAVQPSLLLQSRTAFEIAPMVLLLTLALWFIARGEDGRRRWALAAGAALVLAAFTYSTGRLFAVVVVGALGLVVLLWERGQIRRWLWILPPAVVGAACMFTWTLIHPKLLTARYDLVGVGADHAGFATLVGRTVHNYLGYISPQFLFTHGDTNLRHNSQWGGMLLACTLPLLVAGGVEAFRLRSLVGRLSVLLFFLGPIPAALTAQATPHGLRAATSLPAVLVLCGLGWSWLLRLVLPNLTVLAVCLVVAGGEATFFLNDFFGPYPLRSAAWWDAGERDGLVYAVAHADGHPVVLSESLDIPYIQALVAHPIDPLTYGNRGLAALGMATAPPAAMAAAAPGSLLVLGPGDAVPQGATVVWRDTRLVPHPFFDVAAPDADELLLAVVAIR